ncbi:dUTP pyrophosphatase [Staphylococcus pseudintermedius]|uniref:dUTP diphosphatase n=1 Tax=Staphylococcus pseudintermedius TaxID=283734 RepID=UPI001121057B|nr:dUTP pyrophosphatase [Staphylococcus pseudintermedius]EGQ1741333.1 dUTP pyrophosphatase [Staphylococcus pseudintermedius]EGQ3339875.1 dUTP pyrophosphatase [Staphylococcus pseudintermedius]EGQ3905121.1 dUTP pyrophosphatase [Staphylococcus pseudintermedius]EHD0796289.1 dUTP pyrophosphatase [Staphylococcus pseudintermedius]EHT3418587.1 dUTP pyrophosphatase [Staphylococcus pseudintermedius]
MTNTLQIKLLSENATLPTRNHSTDAGFDIYAAETITLEPQEKALIATDIAVNIPKGYVGLLTSRSGVSSKTHLVIETGKIDAGFQGNMKINIKNDDLPRIPNLRQAKYKDSENNYVETNGKETYRLGTYKIKKGDKLAQLVIVPIWTPELKQVEEFDNETERGEKGFGSSGF